MTQQQDNIESLKRLVTEMTMDAAILAEAYRLRLIGRIWWANLFFVVLPATFAAAAAIFAAGGAGMNEYLSRGLSAFLAGTAAILSAIHKSLKCEEYQTECLRLGAAYDAIATQARSCELSLTVPDPKLDELKELAEKMAGIKANAKAPLPDKYIQKAKLNVSIPLRYSDEKCRL
jgi:hypothetical protein